MTSATASAAVGLGTPDHDTCMTTDEPTRNGIVVIWKDGCKMLPCVMYTPPGAGHMGSMSANATATWDHLQVQVSDQANNCM